MITSKNIVTPTPWMEQCVAQLLQKGIAVGEFPGRGEVAFTYRSTPADSDEDKCALVDAFGTFPARAGQQGSGIHIGHFCWAQRQESYPGKRSVVSPGVVVPHDLPFTSQAAYYFGKMGFPEDYVDQESFEMMVRRTTQEKNRVVNILQGTGQTPKYVDEYMVSPREVGDVILLGSGRSHPLYAHPSYEGLEGTLVHLGLRIASSDKKVLGFVATDFEDYPLEFWERCGAARYQHASEIAVIPFAATAKKVIEMYFDSFVNDWD